MTTPSESLTPPSEPAPSSASAQVALGAGRERRLHPLSWLFVLIEQLKQFALPLFALLFFGRGGDTWEWFGLIGVGVLTGLAVLRYYTYRFRIAGGELVIRSGLLHKNVRHIPLARIQSVALKRNVLHRLLGVAEIKLESAVGGVSAEAQMRVLSMRDAQALETLARASAVAPDEAEALEAERGETLLTLSTGELIKLGLTSNRGLLVGAAGIGVLSQLESNAMGTFVQATGEALFGYARGLHLGGLQWFVAGALLVAAVIALFRAVSVLLVLTQYHGFTLREHDARLSVARGLLTRVRHHAPLRKIQHWTWHDSWLLRWFGRASLRVETAVLEAGNAERSLSELAPIAPPATIEALLARWLPQLNWSTIDWQPLHPRAWRRMAVVPVVFTLLGSVPLCLRFGPLGAAVLLLVPWWIWRARRLAARASWAMTDTVLARRSGWWNRHSSFAEIAKLQGLQLLQSPFDRRHGMASLIADTAGASPFGHRLELHYLPEAVARDLYVRLGARVVRSALKW